MKDSPDWYNFLSRNQRSCQMLRVKDAYGSYGEIFAPRPLTAVPTIFVTRDSQEQVSAAYPHATAEKFASGACSLHTNMVEAMCKARFTGGCSVLIDMAVDLVADFRDCDKTKCAYMLEFRTPIADAPNVGGSPQINTIHLLNDVKIIGTLRSSIHSDNAIFWNRDDSVVDISGLDMRVVNQHNENCSPVLVMQGYWNVTDCKLYDSSGGYVVLHHDKYGDMTNCTLESAHGGYIVHVNAPNLDHINFRGCTFIRNDYAEDFFMDGTNTPQEHKHFKDRMRSKNSGNIFEVNDDEDYGWADCG